MMRVEHLLVGSRKLLGEEPGAGISDVAQGSKTCNAAYQLVPRIEEVQGLVQSMALPLVKKILPRHFLI